MQLPGQTNAISGSVSIDPSKNVRLVMEQSFGVKLKCLGKNKIYLLDSCCH